VRRALGAALLAAIAGSCAAAGDEPERSSNARPPTTAAPTTTAPTPVTAAPPTTTASGVDLCPYRGTGTWVDVYDHVPAFAERGRVSPVGPDAVASMADYGVHTLYLQVAKDDPRSPGVITDEVQAADFLRRAHDAGIKVVAWYLPTHRDHELDVQRAIALARFEVEGERFDGVALDIEGTQAITDIAERNRRLLDLAARLDAAAGDVPLGAIVYPPVAFDVLNPTLWPDFPWSELTTYFDVWLPMVYWTFRDPASGYRDAYRYTVENVQRLRDHVGDPTAPVHVIGGIGDETTDADLEGFNRAVAETGAIGSSIYDFDTLPPAAWPLLRTPSPC